MNNSKSSRTVIRAGSAPKTICYSHTNTRRKFEYQIPSKTTVNNELKGNMLKKTESKPIVEKDNFRRVKVFEMPDSKRCLEPTLAPEELIYVPKRNSSVQKNPGSFETLINRTDNQSSITNCRKTPNKKMYKSFVIGEEVNELPQQKKHTKDGEFKYYDNTTQITSLPGGIKRNLNDIRDDNNKNLERNVHETYNVKLVRDYSSKISCLPTTLKNEEPIKVNTRCQNYAQRESNNNIFTCYNTSQTSNYNPIPSVHNYSSANLITNNYTLPNRDNTFNISNKKVEKNNKLYETSNEEKKLILSSRSKRPDFIRNNFASQITFN